ncbi:MAG TPA: hypothetical protein VGG74_21165 [Kofleriaceae bacterium]
MIPVDQTSFGPDGNCFSACVASILELPIDAVPPFHGDGWWARFVDWCAGRDLYPIFIPRDHDTLQPGRAPGGFTMVGGPCMRNGERSPRLHECVALDGKIVHDPNPCRNGLIEIKDFIVLVPLAKIESRR